VVELAGIARGKRIQELQVEVQRGVKTGKGRERVIRELDALVGGSCVLCGEMAVKLINEPFIKATDDKAEWAL